MYHTIAGSRMGRSAAALVAAVGLMALVGCATLTGAPPAPVTVGQIIKMSHQGLPPRDIIKLMQDSGTAYRLSASQRADLRQKGVPDAVINYMQQTYLNAVRENQVRRDLAYWYLGPDGYYYSGPPYGW